MKASTSLIIYSLVLQIVASMTVEHIKIILITASNTVEMYELKSRISQLNCGGFMLILRGLFLEEDQHISTSYQRNKLLLWCLIHSMHELKYRNYPFFVVEIFSGGTRCPKICYSNIILVQRLKVEIFSNGYAHPKFITYEIFSHEN